MMGQAKANRRVRAEWEAARPEYCGARNPDARPEADGCWGPPGHDGMHTWEYCGQGATGDPYCDVECQRERGHDGPHRHEWED